MIPSSSSSSAYSRLSRHYLSAILAVVTFKTVTAQNKANTWQVVGETGVSAMQIFRGTGNKVYILDKVENNPIQVNGHPAWATEYDTETNTYRVQDVVTNTFCAGGNVLANDTWAVFGGNKAITWGGLDGPQGGGPFDNYNGGTAIRLITPCANKTCEYTTSAQANMQAERWYPTVETLQDGSLAILGGMRDGAYVNSAEADNPTIEYFPSKGPQIGLNILKESLPCNLYPLTWLLPSGNLFIQSNLKASNFDWRAGVEHNLPEIPHAVRVYPASGAAAMLPLTPQNNWTATILFCGGVNLKPKQWMQNPTWNVAAYQTDDTCVSIRPDDESPQWVEEDKMYEGRTLSNFIILPDGRLFHFNGMATGTAGYGNTSWAVGQSFSDNPVMSSAYYDSSAPQGSRWSRPDSLKPMAVERGYHSSATLMADGSIFNAGSNPNVDYIPYKGYVDERGRTYQYPTEYRVEMFYPDYFDEERPKPGSLPKTLSYGGEHFDISLSVKDDLKGNASLIDTVKVVVMRTGYSTHGMNMGMRMVQLNSTWELQEGGGSDQAVIHMAQMPPNAGVMAPGPALLYVVVDGIPSIGVDVMIGNGQTGEQEILPVEDMAGNLAQSGILASSSSGNSSSSGGKTPGTQQGGASSNNTASDKGAAAKAFSTSMQVAMTVLLSASVAILVL